MRRLAACALALLVLGSLGSCTTARSQVPSCSADRDTLLIIMAQAVPTATRLPCVGDLRSGWAFAGFHVTNDLARFWLDSDRAGVAAVEVDLTRSCDTSGGSPVPPASDEVGADVFVVPGVRPRFTAARLVLFEGGCVTYRYRFPAGVAPALALEADDGLSFFPRELLVRDLEGEFDLTLCGAGAPRCPG